MKKLRILSLVLLILIMTFQAACGKNEARNGSITPEPSPSVLPGDEITQQPEPTEVPEAPSPTEKPAENREPVDYSVIQPNEAGEIPIVMFHNFIEDLSTTKDNAYTTSFSEFEKLLETLYNEGYRLISMRDFIDNNISVPAGTKPMVFTFDDGTPGQFSLIEENGKLVVNPKSAVGIMIKFNEKHPDFGLKGIFYLYLSSGDKIFEGAGTLKERLEVLLSYGFEIGSHTWDHFDFTTAQNIQQINEALGKNEKRIREIIEGTGFYSLALPYGSRPSENLRKALVSGEFEGVKYYNETIMAVGSQPAKPSVHVDYDPTYVARIRAQGKVQEPYDLTFWLPKMTNDRMYISDGDPNTVVVPEGMEEKVNKEKLNGKTLITYRK